MNRVEARLYQSDSNPFVRMMLTMMDAMGFLDRVPGNGLYGGYGGYPSSPWSNYSNPYSRALALRGINPGTSSSFLNYPYSSNLYGNNLNSGYGRNPFVTSPWLSSPWLGSGQYGSHYASPLWGTPDWGVLPTLRSPYGYPVYGQSYWSTYDLDEWVDEPWEDSEWNPDAEEPDAQAQAQAPQQPAVQQQGQDAQQGMPLVQNFNFGVPESGQPGRSQPGRSQHNRMSKRAPDRDRAPSPLLKLAPLPEPQSGRPPSAQQRKQSPLRKESMQQTGLQQSRQQPGQQPAQQPDQHLGQQPRRQVREKPCVTEFCGLKKPDMNGLWVAQNGEMLGINGNKFLWGDTQERYLTGQIKIQNEYLLAHVEGSERLMRFKYKLAGDHLLTMQPNGTIREFIRMSPQELYGSYYGGY